MIYKMEENYSVDIQEYFNKILDIDNESSEYDKILLMGNSGVGKSSIRYMIYYKSSQIDTYSLASTIIYVDFIKFLGKRNYLIECGGENKLKKFYFDNASKLFNKVNKFIFIIEAEESRENKDDINENDLMYSNSLDYYEKCLQYLDQYSPNVKIFVLMNKIDLINITRREQVIEKRKNEIKKKSGNFDVNCFPTSIWEFFDLYKIWGEIFTIELNFEKIKKYLSLLKQNLKARKIVVLEKFTFLKIYSVSDDDYIDENLEQMIFMHIKNLYNYLVDEKKRFKELEIENNNNIFIFTELTPSTLIYLIFEKPYFIELIKLNINLVKNEFINILDNYK